MTSTMLTRATTGNTLSSRLLQLAFPFLATFRRTMSSRELDFHTSDLLLFEHAALEFLSAIPDATISLLLLASRTPIDCDPRDPTVTYFPSMSFTFINRELAHFEVPSKQSPDDVIRTIANMGYTAVPRGPSDTKHDRRPLIEISLFYKSPHPVSESLSHALSDAQTHLQAAALCTQQHLTSTHLVADSLWLRLLAAIQVPASRSTGPLANPLEKSPFTNLLAPERHVARAIQQLVGSAFDVNCVVLEHHRESIQWHTSAKASLDPFGADVYTSLASILDDLHTRTTLTAKRFIHRHHDHFHLLYAPFAVRGTQMPMRFAFLAFDTSPLPRLLPESLYGLISRYIREELPEARIRVLAHISQQALRHATSLPYRHIVTGFDWRSTLSTFCSNSFQSLLPVTHAFAITLRLYEQSSESLVLHANETDIREAPKPQYERAKAISLSESAKSLNVRTFTNCAKHHYRTRPHQDYKQALNPFGAKSEICFPLYFKSHPVGTINVEYALSQGYIAEADYLAAVVATIESYLEMLLDSNDKYWLMTQIQYEQNVHEAENAIETLRVPKKRRDAIRRLLSRRLGVDAVEDCNLADLQTAFNSEMSARLQPAGSGLSSSEISHIHELVTFNEMPGELKDAKVPEYWSGLAAIVISNLVSNFFKHCDWEKSATLSFSLRRTIRDSQGRLRAPNKSHKGKLTRSAEYEFIAECRGNTPFDGNTLGSGTVRPVYRGTRAGAQPRKLSRGLLICGIIARHLGGFVHIGNRLVGDNLKPVVQVSIPVPCVPVANTENV